MGQHICYLNVFKLQCVFVFVCMYPVDKKKKENPASKDSPCAHTCSHTEHVLFLCVLSAASDLFLPHQIFSEKSDIWNWEIHSAAPVALWKGQLSLKETVRPVETLRVRGKTVFCPNRSVGGAPALCWLGSVDHFLVAVLNWAALFCAEVLCWML